MMAAGSFGTHALLPCSREFRQAIRMLPNIKDCAVSICCSDLEPSCRPTHCYLIKQSKVVVLPSWANIFQKTRLYVLLPPFSGCIWLADSGFITAGGLRLANI